MVKLLQHLNVSLVGFFQTRLPVIDLLELFSLFSHDVDLICIWKHAWGESVLGSQFGSGLWIYQASFQPLKFRILHEVDMHFRDPCTAFTLGTHARVGKVVPFAALAKNCTHSKILISRGNSTSVPTRILRFKPNICQAMNSHTL